MNWIQEALLHWQGEIFCYPKKTSAPQEAAHNHEGDQAGEQVAQRGCGVSISEILKKSLDMVLGNWL